MLAAKRKRFTLHGMSELNASGSRKLMLKSKTFDQVNVPTSAPAPMPTSVNQILDHNNRVAAQFEKPLEFHPRPNQRRRDYWILMVGGNGLIGLGILLLPKNILITAFGLSGMVVFSLAVTWVLYSVMDRY